MYPKFVISFSLALVEIEIRIFKIYENQQVITTFRKKYPENAFFTHSFLINPCFFINLYVYQQFK